MIFLLGIKSITHQQDTRQHDLLCFQRCPNCRLTFGFCQRGRASSFVRPCIS